MGHVTSPSLFQGRYVICRLGLAMFKCGLNCLRTITCNEGMKGNAKCRHSRFEPPFVGLKGNAQFHLWLDGKHIINFLLVIIALFR